jgi:hypothetical protein
MGIASAFARRATADKSLYPSYGLKRAIVSRHNRQEETMTMKAGDPRLEQAHKELTERIQKYEERIVTVLEGHLAAEQALNDLLRAARRRWPICRQDRRCSEALSARSHDRNVGRTQSGQQSAQRSRARA